MSDIRKNYAKCKMKCKNEMNNIINMSILREGKCKTI